MIISNIEQVPGKVVTQHLGLVQGSTVRAKHAGRDIMAGLKIFLVASLAVTLSFCKSLVKKR